MAVELQKLVALQDNTFYATWRDEEAGLGYNFAAIHDSNGRSQVCNMNLRPPRLTADQMAAATPDRHPAYELADKGAAAKPELANRMQKAAALVEAGSVTLYGNDTATVNGYTITATTCECKDHQHRELWCKHRLAVRMAKALGETAQPVTGNVSSETDFEVKQRKYHAQAKRNAEFKQKRYEDEAAFRKWCNTPEGARRYMLKAAANGRIAAAAGSKLHQKQQQARQQTLESERAYWAEKTRQLFAGGN